MARGAAAQEKGAGDQVASAKKLRLALSKDAAQLFGESRIRRLVAGELEGVAAVEAEPVGPLDEDVVRVFIDVRAGTLIVQAVAPGRKVEVRRVSVLDVEPDIAARYAALATSEAVRAQLSPPRRRPTRPRVPTDAELIAKRERTQAIGLGASLGGGYRFSGEAAFASTSIDLAAHGPILSERLRLSWSTDVAERPTRTVDVTAAIGHRFWLTPHVALFPGAAFGISHVDLATDAETREGEPNALVGGFIELSIDISSAASIVFGVSGNARLFDAPIGARGAELGALIGFAHETPL